MRKLLSAVLASAMALSLASVAFAADDQIDITISDDYYDVSSSKVQIGTANPKIGYGDTAYFVFETVKINGTAAAGYLTSVDHAKQIKAKPQWTQNGDLVEKVTVVKKKLSDDNYAYTLAVTLKDKDTTSSSDIVGKIELSLKSKSKIELKSTGIVAGSDNKLTINPFIEVGYTKADPADAARDNSVTEAELDDDDEIYEFKDDGDAANLKFAEEEEFEFTLYGDAGTFVVDTNGQGKILLSNTVEYNEGLEEIYPDANYVYITGNGKSFNKTGTLTLNADEGTFLYQVKNGKLVKVNAEYDDVEEGFVIKTRTLGTYVIAEEELDLELQNKVEEVPAEEGEVVAEPTPNPSTGAVA